MQQKNQEAQLQRQQVQQEAQLHRQETEKYYSKHRQYNALLGQLPLIDGKIKIIQSAFQDLLRSKKRRVEIMETYPTNELAALLSYLRFKQISKITREWADLSEREKTIQEKMEKHQTEQAEILKTKLEEMEKKQKQQEIEILQQQINKLKNDV